MTLWNFYHYNPRKLYDFWLFKILLFFCLGTFLRLQAQGKLSGEVAAPGDVMTEEDEEDYEEDEIDNSSEEDDTWYKDTWFGKTFIIKVLYGYEMKKTLCGNLSVETIKLNIDGYTAVKVNL